MWRLILRESMLGLVLLLINGTIEFRLL
jgi:hypothetical protein